MGAGAGPFFGTPGWGAGAGAGGLCDQPEDILMELLQVQAGEAGLAEEKSFSKTL